MSLNLVLIDTSAWIMALGKVNIPPIKERVNHLLREDMAAITPIIYLELLGGTSSEAEFNDLTNLLESLHELNIGKKEWKEAARLAFELRREGKTIPSTDIIIASIALHSGAMLLHADHHFDLIADTIGLKVESLVSLVQKKR